MNTCDCKHALGAASSQDSSILGAPANSQQNKPAPEGKAEVANEQCDDDVSSALASCGTSTRCIASVPQT